MVGTFVKDNYFGELCNVELCIYKKVDSRLVTIR